MDERVNLTDLIHRAEKGDAEASDRLFAETYADLRKLARRRLMRDRRTSLDTAALVHESYLRFAASGRLHLEDRVHFIRWAGQVMRSVIVDFARRRSAARRGGRRRCMSHSRPGLPTATEGMPRRFCECTKRSTRLRHSMRVSPRSWSCATSAA